MLAFSVGVIRFGAKGPSALAPWDWALTISWPGWILVEALEFARNCPDPGKMTPTGTFPGKGAELTSAHRPGLETPDN